MSSDSDFDKYCAKVIGAKGITIDGAFGIEHDGYFGKYSPHDDLNQRIPVFDHLYRQLREHDARDIFWDIYKLGFDKASMKFIISTMEKDNESNR